SSSSSSSSSGSSDWNIISFGPLRKRPQPVISTTLSTTTSSTPPTTSSTANFNTSFTFPPPVSPCSSNSSSSPELSIPYITNLWVKNITSSSFQLLWNFPPQINLTSKLVLFHGTHQLGIVETELSDWTWTKLQPGVLYTAHVALCMCGSCGNATELKVKTDAQTLKAVVRITNVNFTVDLQNPESKEYKTFIENVTMETLQSLPFWVLDLVNSGKVLVLITHLAPGSVVVTFTLVFLPSTKQDIYKIASYLMESLQNSSQFTFDRNFTEITDVDECALGEVDCSSGAKCENMFGSYTCVCLHGYIDANPERPGRTCQENNMAVSGSSPSPSTTTISTTSTMSSLTENTNITSSIPVTHGTDVTVRSSTADWSDNKTTELTSTSSITQTTAKTASTSTSNTTMPFISQTELITVECGPGYMDVYVSRNFLELKHISESSLYLGVPSCNVTQVNVNHVKLFVAWGTCGTQLRQNNQNSTVQVTLCNTDMRLQVPVICTYINSFIISAGYGTSGYHTAMATTSSPVLSSCSTEQYDTINNVVEGSGMYHVTVRLLNGTNPLPQNYTLSPEDKVIIEVGLNSNMSQIKVVINKCWAHPSNNATEPPQSIFLEY
ncbi:uromodulin-like 1 isoform X1, partial [Tachysurus ichikawai]